MDQDLWRAQSTASEHLFKTNPYGSGIAVLRTGSKELVGESCYGGQSVFGDAFTRGLQLRRVCLALTVLGLRVATASQGQTQSSQSLRRSYSILVWFSIPLSLCLRKTDLGLTSFSLISQRFLEAAVTSSLFPHRTRGKW